MIEIKFKRNKKSLKTKRKITLKQFVEEKVNEGANLKGANLRGADLRYAYLKGADLEGADLRYAYLKGADLRGADLRYAYLKGANLRDAYLEGAYLRYANLDIKSPPVNSKQFISEILYKEAETESQLDFCARIRMQYECRYNWKYFIELAKKKKVFKWAYKILSKWSEYKNKIKEEMK